MKVTIERAEVLADLIGCYQVQRSRLSGEIRSFNPPSARALQNLGDPTTGRGPVVFTLVKTVELFIRVNELLPYARTKANAISEPTFGKDKIDTALFQLAAFDVLKQEERERIYALHTAPS